MSRESGPSMVKALRMVLANVTPYEAAKRCDVALSTMYRNSLYKLHKAGEDGKLRKELKRLDAKHKATGGK